MEQTDRRTDKSWQRRRPPADDRREALFERRRSAEHGPCARAIMRARRVGGNDSTSGRRDFSRHSCSLTHQHSSVCPACRCNAAPHRYTASMCMMHEPGTHMTEWWQQRRSLEQRPGTMPTTPTHSSPPRRIFKYEFVASLPLSPSVKEFGKSVDIWGSYAQEFSVLFFSDSQCRCQAKPVGSPPGFSPSRLLIGSPASSAAVALLIVHRPSQKAR